MKIIKPGDLSKVQSWTTSCSNCGCEYSFTWKDTIPVYDPDKFGRDKVQYYYQCPCCGKWRKSMML